MKSLKGTLILNKDIESNKFSVVFPMDVRMKCIQDVKGSVMCEHPRFKNIWTVVELKDIRTLKWE
jgi:hypothetical protein